MNGDRSERKTISLKNGVLWYTERRFEAGKQGLPTHIQHELGVTVSEEHIQIGCTMITREAWNEIERVVSSRILALPVSELVTD